uniref:Uncharacterized protein n=1 Tax=Romanomermis culicivorax TaxID=13658 RepID=A0A915IB87_ROMCU
IDNVKVCHDHTKNYSNTILSDSRQIKDCAFPKILQTTDALIEMLVSNRERGTYQHRSIHVIGWEVLLEPPPEIVGHMASHWATPPGFSNGMASHMACGMFVILSRHIFHPTSLIAKNVAHWMTIILQNGYGGQIRIGRSEMLATFVVESTAGEITMTIEIWLLARRAMYYT